MKILKQIWHSKWFPRIFYIKPDGGKDSGVTAYFLIEWKILFSIGILHFKEGGREAYHNHAFNALTWWLKGSITEERISNLIFNKGIVRKNFKSSFKPKYTLKDNFHRVIAHKDTYALTFRGAWKDTWQEFKNEKYITLTHGRKEI